MRELLPRMVAADEHAPRLQQRLDLKVYESLESWFRRIG